MKISTTESTESALTIVVEGRLDAVAAPQLRARLDQAFEEGHHDLIVDLSRTSFVDSAGLAALVRAMKASRQEGADLKLIRPASDEAFRVFELTNVNAVFDFVPAVAGDRRTPGQD